MIFAENFADEQSCVLQVDKEDFVSYFVKAVNTSFLENRK